MFRLPARWRASVMPSNTTAAANRRHRPGLFDRDEKRQLRRRLLVAAGLFEVLAVALLIGLNVGGQRVGDGGRVLAPDTYLLAVRMPSCIPQRSDEAEGFRLQALRK
jgi:hypothetical protein